MYLHSLMKNDINLINNDMNVSAFKLMSATTDGILAGQKAYSLVNASTFNGLETITTDSVTLSRGRIFSITFSAEPLKYVEYLQTARKMFESLNLMKS